MDQNQPSVDNDLQKAIDDITNTTNIDPVFSDPVAAPSSVPEGDTGELGEPVGPFPEPKLEVVAPAPEAIAPLDAASNIPDLAMPEAPAAPAPAERRRAPVPARPCGRGRISPSHAAVFSCPACCRGSERPCSRFLPCCRK